MQSRRGRTGHFGERGTDNIGGATEFRFAEPGCLNRHLVEFVLLDAAQHRRSAAAGRGNDDEVAKPLQEVLDETPGVLPGLDHAIRGGKRGGRIPRSDRVDHFPQKRRVGVAEECDSPLVLDGVAFRPRHELVEQGKGVAHRSAAGAHDERQDARCHGDFFAVAHALRVFEHLRGRDKPERVVVRARANRPDDFVRFGCRKDELHVLRWFLHDLEERVETLRRHHVRLVEDENLVAVAGRGEHGALAQVPGIIDPIVAGCVDFDDIERTAAIPGQLPAARALPARRVRGAFGAVEAPGEDARRSRLAASTRTAEQVCMIHPVRAQRRHERLGHLRLSDQFGERFRPVAAIKGGDHHPMLLGRTDLTPSPGSEASTPGQISRGRALPPGARSPAPHSWAPPRR